MAEAMRGKNLIFAAFVVVQAIFYGVDNVVMKVAYGEISPLWCQTLRFGLAFALFMLLFGKQIVSGLRNSSPRVWLPVGVVYAVAFISSALAVDMTSATNAGFFISLPMLFTPVIAFAIMRRTYRLDTLVLQVAVLAGLYLLCCNGGALSFGLGEFVGLGSSALFALGIVLSERGLDEIGPAAMSAVQTGGAFLFSLGGAVATEQAPVFAEISLSAWAAVAFLGIAGTCLAFWLQNKALAHIPAATVSVILCSEPVVTAIVSFFVLGEVLSAMGILGAAIIVGCTIAATLLDSRAEAKEQAEVPAFETSFDAVPAHVSVERMI